MTKNQIQFVKLLIPAMKRENHSNEEILLVIEHLILFGILRRGEPGWMVRSASSQIHRDRIHRSEQHLIEPWIKEETRGKETQPRPTEDDEPARKWTDQNEKHDSLDDLKIFTEEQRTVLEHDPHGDQGQLPFLVIDDDPEEQRETRTERRARGQ